LVFTDWLSVCVINLYGWYFDILIDIILQKDNKNPDLSKTHILLNADLKKCHLHWKKSNICCFNQIHTNLMCFIKNIIEIDKLSKKF
jgi:hypothetical protein